MGKTCYYGHDCIRIANYTGDFGKAFENKLPPIKSIHCVSKFISKQSGIFEGPR